MTLPQIIMLNHAAWVNRERAQESSDKKDKEFGGDAVFAGKRVDELNSDEFGAYFKQEF